MNLEKKTAESKVAEKTSSIYDLEMLAVLVGIGAVYFNVGRVQEGILISYKDPNTGLYGKGPADIYFVLIWATLLTFIRTILKTNVFLPVAKAYKMESSKLAKFSEQCWNLLYASVSWAVGMYITYNSPYWLNVHHLWIDYPHIPFTGLMKSYYLVQSAFWVHQLLLLNLEERRKDHYPMMLHHFITLLLLGASYCFNFVRIGNVVMITMDLADIFLPLAKLLGYMKFRLACDIAFGMFATSWILTRHFLFGYLIYSVSVHSWDYVDWNPAEEKYLSATTLYSFLTLFVLLELIIIYWFFLILKVALKLFSGEAPAHDNRSDSE